MNMPPPLNDFVGEWKNECNAAALTQPGRPQGIAPTMDEWAWESFGAS
jgi:hypothetical protein